MLSRHYYLFLSLFVSGFLLSANSLAQGLEINLGDETIQVRYSTNAGGSNYGRSELTYGVLHNTEVSIDLLEVGLLVIDVAGSKAPGLEVGIGPKLYFVSDRDFRSSAIGLGGTLRYKLGSNSRFYLAGQGFYAPGVVAFADAKSMYEAGIEFGFEVLKNAEIYVGRRDIEIDYAGFSTKKIDESSYFGMRIRF